MRIDWVVAIIIFLMFTGWAFSHYTLLKAGETFSRAESAFLAGERIVDYVKVTGASIPANFSSTSVTEDVTLWAYMNWTNNTINSTRVVEAEWSNQSLPCMIAGDKLYWLANLTTGDNSFSIEYAELNTSLNCDQSLAQLDENQTVLWATEIRRQFSSAKNAQICSKMNNSYGEMKKNIGITFDFNILIETDGSVLTCGSRIPRTGREVFVFPASGVLWEGGDINVSARLWL